MSSSEGIWAVVARGHVYSIVEVLVGCHQVIRKFFNHPSLYVVLRETRVLLYVYCECRDVLNENTIFRGCWRIWLVGERDHKVHGKVTLTIWSCTVSDLSHHGGRHSDLLVHSVIAVNVVKQFEEDVIFFIIRVEHRRQFCSDPLGRLVHSSLKLVIGVHDCVHGTVVSVTEPWFGP